MSAQRCQGVTSEGKRCKRKLVLYTHPLSSVRCYQHPKGETEYPEGETEYPKGESQGILLRDPSRCGMSGFLVGAKGFMGWLIMLIIAFSVVYYHS